MLSSISFGYLCIKFVDHKPTIMGNPKYASILLGLGRYGKQPIGNVFNTDLADTVRIRYNKHVHNLKFQSQEFWISTTNVLG